MSQDRFAQLWTDYLEGELDEASLAELSAMFQADPVLLQTAVDLYQTHRLLGIAATPHPQNPASAGEGIAAREATATREAKATRDAFVQATLARLPVSSDQFTGSVMRQLPPPGPSSSGPVSSSAVSSAENTRRPLKDCTKNKVGFRSAKANPFAERKATMPESYSSWVPKGRPYRWVAAAAAVVAVAFIARGVTRPPEQQLVDVRDGAQVEPGALTAINVRLKAASRARFFGELAPQLHSAFESQREYVVTEGLVELEFPQGALVIIESPAVFRILSETSLALDSGQCSVHAPAGAEGFQVETPSTQIVDRGTRFSVSVAENNETVVQVVEGRADVYPLAPPQPSQQTAPEPAREVRLHKYEARRFTTFGDKAVSPVGYSPGIYRRELPDRVVRYQATPAANGTAEKLQSVTVQRGGQVVEYSFDQLIPAEVVWFQSANAIDRSGHLAAGEAFPNPVSQLLADPNLNSGLINPGGSVQPLASSPVMNVPPDPAVANTPGFAVQFRAPIVNGPGPDVVFFELQTFSNPLDGDAFHVSPLEFAPGRKSHTVRVYDLTMTSRESLRLAPFSLYRYSRPIGLLAELSSATSVRASPGTRFHALAVGIDLSDLGFAEGEQVAGLFFQDAGDDDHLVDPVFIGGLPAR